MTTKKRTNASLYKDIRRESFFRNEQGRFEERLNRLKQRGHKSVQKSVETSVELSNTSLIDNFNFYNSCNAPDLNFRVNGLTLFLILNCLIATSVANQTTKFIERKEDEIFRPGSPEEQIYPINYDTYHPAIKKEPPIIHNDKLDKKDEIYHREMKAMETKLINCIKPSKIAKEEYKKLKNRSYDDDKNTVVTTILKLAQNKEFYCKLKSVLEDANNVKIKICLADEINDSKGRVLYDRFTNKIKLPLTEIDKSSFESILDHEFHHAFVNYQNRKTNRKFFHHETDERIFVSEPCDPDEHYRGHTNCTEIRGILDKGEKKIDALLAIPVSNLTPQQQTLMDDYIAAFNEGYQPYIDTYPIDKALLDSLFAEGALTEELKFVDPRRRHVITHPSGYKIYADNFEPRDGKYFANVYTHDYSQRMQAPLHDFKHLVNNHILKSAGVTARTKEIDAMAYQLFGKFPKLYNFFFEGLRDYHHRRSDANYQSCREENIKLSR
jgi:hypothetical protein